MAERSEQSASREAIESKEGERDKFEGKTETGQLVTLILSNEGEDGAPHLFYRFDANEELVEFVDTERPGDERDYKAVQRDIGEKYHIIITDHEAKRIARKFYEISVESEKKYLDKNGRLN